MHKNLKNGKMYIGQTKRKPKERWQNGTGYSHSIVFLNAIKKAGGFETWNTAWEHILLETEIPTQQKANELEKYYINKFRTYIGFSDCQGYNMTLGGDSYEHLKNGQSIYQIDRNTLVILKTYKTISDIPYNLDGINNCLQHNSKTAYGFIWIYKDEYDILGLQNCYKAKYFPNEPVYYLESDMDYINSTEAATATGCSRSAILECCHGKRIHTKGKHFCFVKDKSTFKFNLKHKYNKRYNLEMLNFLSENVETKGYKYCAQKLGKTVDSIKQACHNYLTVRPNKELENIRKSKKVRCIELNLIFNSIKEAAEYFKTTTSNIRTALKDKNRTAREYHWEYVE